MKTLLNLGLKIKTMANKELALKLNPFNVSDVKIGNIKDPDKIKQKIIDSEQDHIVNTVNTSALKSCTCFICHIGLVEEYDNGDIEYKFFINKYKDSDKELLQSFWEYITQLEDNFIDYSTKKLDLYSYNGHSFDFPILLKRSILNNICITTHIIPHYLPDMMSWDKWNSSVVNNFDLAKLWSFETYSIEKFFTLVSAFNLQHKAQNYIYDQHKNFNQLEFCNLDENTSKMYLQAELDYIHQLYNKLI